MSPIINRRLPPIKPVRFPDAREQIVATIKSALSHYPSHAPARPGPSRLLPPDPPTPEQEGDPNAL